MSGRGADLSGRGEMISNQGEEEEEMGQSCAPRMVEERPETRM